MEKYTHPKVFCPYCNSEAAYESSKKVYGGRDFGMMYICKNYPECDSYVGCHNQTKIPLGRLSNSDLRKWKMKAHASFDPLWKKDKNRKKGARSKWYKWLSNLLIIDYDDCHIGYFDIDTCKKVVELCKKLNPEEI